MDRRESMNIDRMDLARLVKKSKSILKSTIALRNQHQNQMIFEIKNHNHHRKNHKIETKNRLSFLFISTFLYINNKIRDVIHKLYNIIHTNSSDK